MKVKVELVYDGGKEPRQIEVTINDRHQGSGLLNAVDKAVEKQEKNDKDWVRWNLIDIGPRGEK